MGVFVLKGHGLGLETDQSFLHLLHRGCALFNSFGADALHLTLEILQAFLLQGNDRSHCEQKKEGDGGE